MTRCAVEGTNEWMCADAYYPVNAESSDDEDMDQDGRGSPEVQVS